MSRMDMMTIGIAIGLLVGYFVLAKPERDFAIETIRRINRTHCEYTK